MGLKVSMYVLREKRGISYLLFWGDNGGRTGKKGRVEAMRDGLEAVSPFMSTLPLTLLQNLQ